MLGAEDEKPFLNLVNRMLTSLEAISGVTCKGTLILEKLLNKNLELCNTDRSFDLKLSIH